MSRYKKYLAISCFCVVAETALELITPIIMADITDIGVVDADKDYILIKGAQMIACVLIALMLGILHARYVATARQGFGVELRKDEFAKVQSFPPANADHSSTSSLITRLTSDMTTLQTTISNRVCPIVRSPVMLLTALVLAFIINAQLAVVFLITTPVLGIVLFVVVRRVGPLCRLIQASIDKVNAIVQKNLNVIRVAKSYARGTHEEGKFEKVNSSLHSASERALRTSVRNLPLFQLVMYTAIVCIVWSDGDMIFAGTMEMGKLVGFLDYILQTLSSLMMVNSVFLMLIRSIVSGERILEMLGEEVDVHNLPQATASVQHGDTAFDHVYLRYRGEVEGFVLSSMTLHAEKGSTVGILGGASSAKTALVQLIPRPYDVSDGEIRIGGRNVREYPVKHLRDAIGIMLQKNALSSGTIRENLLQGNAQASDADIAWACCIACVDGLVSSFPGGYDTDLGQGGVSVSGGQKRRLCITRALLKRPKVLIFGDSTGAADTATEASIREGPASLEGITKIIIAQRVTSIQHANQIVTLDDGKIHTIGTHDTLFASDPIHQDIYYSQQEGAGL